MVNLNNNYLNTWYSEELRPKSTYPQDLANHLVNRFQIPRGSSILDVGCGRGDFLGAFAKAGLCPTGVDISDVARSQVGGVEVFIADFENEILPFRDNHFDTVFSKSVVEHLLKPEKLMLELHRVVKPGGLVITMCPSWEYQWRIFYADYTHRTPLMKSSLQALKEVCGFEEVTVEHFRQLPLLWEKPWLTPLSSITRICLPRCWSDSSKWIRFSKEIMLLGVGRKSI